MKSVEEILTQLVSMDTTSHKSNMALIHWVKSYLSEFGIKAQIFESPEGDKANLLATIGPALPGGILLSGHTDVVPVMGQEWRHSPFQLTQVSGRLYGRGTADMKGFIAAVLAAVPTLSKASLKRPVHIALTYDEEIGCGGIQALIEPLKAHIPAPQLVVIGEPTEMRVANSHKGQHVYRTEILGRAAHSSDPSSGVNAVNLAARLIVNLEDIYNSCQNGPFDDAFDPPFTTVNVGPIQGGSAFNIVAERCWFEWDQRPIPGEDGSAVLKPFEEMVNRLDHEVKSIDDSLYVRNRRWSHLPPLQARPGSDAEHLALSLARRNETTVVAFGTEGGFVQKGLDWPVVICGPGSIAQAHKPDEYIEITQLEKCCLFMERILDALVI